jgi:hypothetical protein
MPVNPNGDELERDLIEQTPNETLKAVGQTQVATTASAFGKIPIQGVVSVTDTYKREQRAQATQGETPEDVNGLGYQFTNTTENQV